MRNLLTATVLVAPLPLLAALPATAQIPQGYVGAGVTQARIDDIFGSDAHLDLNNTAWKVFAGVRPIKPLALEMDYMDFGSETRDFGFGTSAHAEAHAFAAYAVGFIPLPVPFFEVFGKAGAARWNLSGHSDSSLFAIDDHGTNFSWGVGAQFHFGPVGARLEYEEFKIRDADTVKAASVGVSFNFL